MLRGNVIHCQQWHTFKMSCKGHVKRFRKNERRREKKGKRQTLQWGGKKDGKENSFYLCLYLPNTHTNTLFCILEEKPLCLNSFGIKFELNKSADLPLRQYMSYREHWAIKPGGQKHCWEITHGGLWFGLGLTREKREEEGRIEHVEFQSSKKQKIHTSGGGCSFLLKTICSSYWR